MASLGSATRHDGRPGAQPGAGADVTISRRMVPAIHREACTGHTGMTARAGYPRPYACDRYGRDPFMTGNGRQDNPDAAAVPDLHPGQAPGLHGRLCHNRGSTGRARREHPGPGPRSSPGSRPGRPRTRRPRATPGREEHQPGIIRRPCRRPRQMTRAGQVTAEAAAAIQVAGAQQAGCSERPRHHSSITLSDAEGRGERARCRRSGRLRGEIGEAGGLHRLVDLACGCSA